MSIVCYQTRTGKIIQRVVREQKGAIMEAIIKGWRILLIQRIEYKS